MGIGAAVNGGHHLLENVYLIKTARFCCTFILFILSGAAVLFIVKSSQF